jgi:hypothetical protein
MSLGSFLTNRSGIGEPYNMGTILGPDGRFEEDLAAIDRYVREEARPKVKDFPQSLPVIEEYEKWAQGLGWYDRNVVPNDTMNAAKAKRNAINEAQQNVLPTDSVVEEGSYVASPPDVTKEVGTQVSLKSVLITSGVLALVGTAVFGAYKLSPLSLAKRAAGRILKGNKS